jgi:ribosome-binding protein aMBF1 (putative translation factor)
MEITEDILKAVNRKRGELNISKKELAKAVGIAESTVYRWNTQTTPFKVQKKVFALVVEWIAKNN